MPPQVDGVAGRIARELSEQPLALDEVTQARMERTLVQAWRTRSAAQVPLPVRRRPRGGRLRFAWGMSVAVAAAAGALLSVYVDKETEAEVAAAGTAHFELRIADGSVHSGSVGEGQVLETGKHGHMEVDVGRSRVDITRGTRVRFDRISYETLQLSLTSGRVEVAFHPTERGEQHMSVETRAARVVVVGTVFSVEVDAFGNTAVAVSEGVVEVVPRGGGAPRRVAAGEHTEVRIDAGDAVERAVREAIAEDLRTVGDEVDEALAGEAEEDLEAELVEPDMDFTDSLPAAQRPVRANKPATRTNVLAELERARDLLRQGKHTAARAQLRDIATSNAHKRDRVEAMTLIAESYTAQGYIPRATDSYRQAARIAPGHAAGHNALFALARLLDRYTVDRAAAMAAYRRYLSQAPSGALAPQAHAALCRLGESEHCER